MELKLEWQRRTEAWLKALSGDIYHPVGTLEAEGFVTSEQLSLSEAMNRVFSPVNSGDRWGKNWEYLWLRGKIAVPAELAGKRIGMSIEAGGESSLFVNGKEFGCRRNDWVRDPLQRICDLTLTRSAEAGEVFELALEVYAGHDSPGTVVGPIVGGEFDFKFSDSTRCTYDKITYGVWNELAYQLYLDVKYLYRALRAMSDNELRYWDIFDALKDFTCIVDFEADEETRNSCYAEARERLKPIFEQKNGTVAPEFFAFGNSHIDVAWLWPLAETERKVNRTFAAQIRLMDEYPEYKFLQSQPHLYRMVKELYPALYEEIKEKVAAGQWIPEGAMWVEPDMNIVSGESLIRQIIHGKRFFKEEFNYDSKILWLPDVFGYNAALPQILKKSGVDYFCTQKLWWAYNGGELFPYNYFNWVGIDGTAVPTFLHVNYTSDTEADEMINRWNQRRQRHGLRGFMVPYGFGDGGGGPCRDFIENVRRGKDFEGIPKMIPEGPIEFFEHHPLPTENYVGELYLQCHRGVQTSQARTKRNNRKCEISLRETEFWGVVAKQNGAYYPLDVIDKLWKDVLLCQFHDILPGSSITRVYEEAEKLHAEVLATSEGIRGSMKSMITKDSAGLCIFNSLSFARKALVQLPYDFTGAEINGNSLPVQCIGGSLYTEVFLPQCGYVTVANSLPVPSETNSVCNLTDNGAVLENDLIRVEFNEYGAISSIYDKSEERELTSGTCNEMKMFKDIPNQYDAWDVDLSYESNPVQLPEKAGFELVAESGLIAAVRITRKLNNSLLIQTVSLNHASKRVNFETTVDWHELHKMLKVGFAVDYHCEEAIQEIQFGYIKRPNHRSKQFDHDRFEVANHKYTALAEANRGFAVLNDCKYGVNVLGDTINLTLLRSPIAPDPQCDQGIQTFTYSFYPYTGSFTQSGVVREAYDLNVPVETVHGKADGQVLAIDNEQIVLEALKPAEDGSNDFILRLYESTGSASSATVTLNLPCKTVSISDMLENATDNVTVNGSTFTLDFSAFEIKTIRVSAV